MKKNYTLFCLLVEYDLMSYDETAWEDKWRKFMDDKIETISKDDT